MEEYYLWIKTVHIIAVISFMAGMLYLPRLFVYHCQVEKESEEDKRFQLMEKKLLRAIINPAMVVALVTGLMLMSALDAHAEKWFQIKFGLFLLMGMVHVILSKSRKAFAKGENKKSEKYFRVLNEIPAVIMIAMVILVVVKPAF